MSMSRTRTAMAVMLAVALVGLSGAPGRSESPAQPADIVWEGDVFLNETLVVAAGQTLTILPGTTVHIKGVPASCTEGNMPMLAVNGSLSAAGTVSQPIRFISGDDESGCSGREAMVIYTVDRARASVIANAQFVNGTLMISGAAATIRNSTFTNSYIELWKDRSLVENCSLTNTPIYVYHESSTVIQNNTIRRDLPDEIGIYPSDGVSIAGNRISGCLYGIQASTWITADVRNNTITGCTEGIHSFGNMTVEDNIITGNDIGVNSTGGTDHVRGNLITGNGVGVVTFGDPRAVQNNTFIGNGSWNRLADLQQKLLAQVKVVDGNGLELAVLVRITDRSGNELFHGDGGLFILTKYERAPDGTEYVGGPFTASASMAGVANSTVFDDVFQASVYVRLELLPELALTGFLGPRPGLRPDDIATLRVTMVNSGNVAAGGFELAIFVDGQRTFRRQVGTLAAGEQRTYEFCWTAREGRHRFVASLDAGGQVREQTEGNNELALGAVVAPAPRLPPFSTGIMLLLLIGAGGAAMLVSKK